VQRQSGKWVDRSVGDGDGDGDEEAVVVKGWVCYCRCCSCVIGKARVSTPEDRGWYLHVVEVMDRVRVTCNRVMSCLVYALARM